MEDQHENVVLIGFSGSCSRDSSWALRVVEQEHRRKHCNQDGHETLVDLHPATFKGEATVFYMPEGSYHSDWDRKMESLHR